jgi:hypothetical protein
MDTNLGQRNCLIRREAEIDQRHLAGYGFIGLTAIASGARHRIKHANDLISDRIRSFQAERSRKQSTGQSNSRDVKSEIGLSVPQDAYIGVGVGGRYESCPESDCAKP